MFWIRLDTLTCLPYTIRQVFVIVILFGYSAWWPCLSTSTAFAIYEFHIRLTITVSDDLSTIGRIELMCSTPKKFLHIRVSNTKLVVSFLERLYRDKDHPHTQFYHCKPAIIWQASMICVVSTVATEWKLVESAVISHLPFRCSSLRLGSITLFVPFKDWKNKMKEQRRINTGEEWKVYRLILVVCRLLTPTQCLSQL